MVATFWFLDVSEEHGGGSIEILWYHNSLTIIILTHAGVSITFEVDVRAS